MAVLDLVAMLKRPAPSFTLHGQVGTSKFSCVGARECRRPLRLSFLGPALGLANIKQSFIFRAWGEPSYVLLLCLKLSRRPCFPFGVSGNRPHRADLHASPLVPGLSPELQALVEPLPSRIPASGDDCVVLVKQWLADADLSQPPLCALPFAAFHEVEEMVNKAMTHRGPS
jgi:hypothetical protein